MMHHLAMIGIEERTLGVHAGYGSKQPTLELSETDMAIKPNRVQTTNKNGYTI